MDQPSNDIFLGIHLRNSQPAQPAQLRNYDLDFFKNERHLPENDQIDVYHRCRSWIISGEYEAASNILDNYSKSYLLSAGDYVPSFIRIQIEIFRNHGWADGIVKLKAMGTDKTSILSAEHKFIIGFCYLNLHKYRQASSFFIAASKLYTALDLPYHQANCLFNLSVCHLSLNERTALAASITNLENISTYSPNHKMIRHLLLRAKTYQAIDEGNFSVAVKYLEEVIPIYFDLSRSRDLGDSYCSIAFCYMKNLNFSSVDDLLEKIVEEAVKLEFRHALVLGFYQELRLSDTHTLKSAKLLLNKWLKSDCHIVYILNLCEVLLDDLSRQKNYKCQLDIAVSASLICAKSHQINSGPDFLFYEIEALFYLGRVHEALTKYRLFSSSLVDPEDLRRRARGKILDILFRDFQTLVKPKLLKIMVDDPGVEIDGKAYKLSRSLTLFKAIVALAKSPGTLILDQFFKEIYGVSFSPLRHASRVNSLLTRIRDILGANSIVRREGFISLAAGIEVEPFYFSDSLIKVVYRKNLIKEILAKAKREMTISDLGDALSIKRRTLQLDLRQLTENGSVKFTGHRRGRRYYL